MEESPILVPLGLMPRQTWDQKRIVEISAAIARYEKENFEVPKEWRDEFNEILKRYKK